jgi:IS5 family transposase
LHVSIDKCCKLIRKLAVTLAAVADLIVFEVLVDSKNTNCDKFAAECYSSVEREVNLTRVCWCVQIQQQGTTTCSISMMQNQRNHRIAVPRARVEHVFDVLAPIGGKFVRCQGIVLTSLSCIEGGRLHLKYIVFLQQSGLIPF